MEDDVGCDSHFAETGILAQAMKDGGHGDGVAAANLAADRAGRASQHGGDMPQAKPLRVICMIKGGFFCAKLVVVWSPWRHLSRVLLLVLETASLSFTNE